jgi:quercetin dioxygenase-like cupin family protein
MKPASGVALLAALLLASTAAAQTDTVHKTTLQDVPFPPPIYHTATVRTEVDAGGEVAPHTHPGVEMGYILEGQAELSVRDNRRAPLAPATASRSRRARCTASRTRGPGR